MLPLLLQHAIFLMKIHFFIGTSPFKISSSTLSSHDSSYEPFLELLVLPIRTFDHDHVECLCDILMKNFHNHIMDNVKHSFHNITIDSLRHVSQYVFDNQKHIQSTKSHIAHIFYLYRLMHNYRFNLNFNSYN